MTDNISGAANVFGALARLDEQGLASADEPRGLNDQGIQTLGDLLSVATFQFGASEGHAAEVGSATARAALSALSDVISDIRGAPTDSTETLTLLLAATQQARQD